MAGADSLHCLHRRCRHRRRALPGPADRLRLLLRGDNGEEVYVARGGARDEQPPARSDRKSRAGGDSRLEGVKG